MSSTPDEIAMKLISMERQYDTLKDSHKELIDTCEMAIGGISAILSLRGLIDPTKKENELVKLIKEQVQKAKKI